MASCIAHGGRGEDLEERRAEDQSGKRTKMTMHLGTWRGVLLAAFWKNLVDFPSDHAFTVHRSPTVNNRTNFKFPFSNFHLGNLEHGPC